MAAYCFRGEWGFQLSIPYALGDVVSCFGLFWQCNTAGTKVQPGTNGDWTLLSDPYEQYLRPSSLKRETFPRSGVGFASVPAPTSGTMVGQSLTLMAGDLVTNIVFATSATAAATITHGWFALYDSSFNLLRQSTDATTAVPATTLVSKALSSTYRVTSSGLYYIAFLLAASTMPTLLGAVPLSGSIVTSTLPRTSFTDTTHTGLTTTAPNPATAATYQNQLYGGIS